MTRCILALGVVIGAATARADEVISPDDERAARRLYEKGLRAYQEEKWDEAIASFLEAQELAPAPALHYNIAQAYRLKGDCQKALVEYKRFLREDPESANRQRVLVRVAEMQKCVAKPARSDPAEGGEDAQVQEDEDPLLTPEPRKRKPSPPGQVKKIAGYITIGVGALLVGGGYVLGKRASQREDEISRLFAEGGEWSDEYANLEKDGHNAATMSAIAYGAGAVAVVTGAVLVYLGGKDAERPAVTPMAGRGTRGVSLTWEF